MRAAFLAALLLLPVVASAQTPPTAGIDYQQARREFPGLSQITFDKADLNHDGIIERNELPVLQSIYQMMYKDR